LAQKKRGFKKEVFKKGKIWRTKNKSRVTLLLAQMTSCHNVCFTAKTAKAVFWFGRGLSPKAKAFSSASLTPPRGLGKE